MEFLKALKEAISLGVTKEEFIPIWKAEMQQKSIVKDGFTVKSQNPVPNLMVPQDNRESSSIVPLFEQPNAVMENVVSELKNLNQGLKTLLDMQVKTNEKLSDLSDRKHTSEHRKDYTGETLNHHQARSKHSNFNRQPADHFISYRAADIRLILATSYDDHLNKITFLDVIPTPLDMRSSPRDVPAIKHQSGSGMFGSEVPDKNMQNPKEEVPAAQDQQVKTRAPRQRATMRRLSRHSNSVSAHHVATVLKENVNDRLEFLAEVNGPIEKKDKCKNEILTEEDYGEKEVKIEEESHGKKEVKVKVIAQGKREFNFKVEAQNKKVNNFEMAAQSKKEVKTKGIGNPGSQYNGCSKGKLCKAEERNDLHMTKGRRVDKCPEEHNIMQNPLQSSELAAEQDDLPEKSFKYRYIDITGRFLIGSLSQECSCESDYFYTRGLKKCKVKLRLAFKKDNVMSVQLCVSQVPGVSEYIWPIFFDGSGKVFNRKADKPSPL